MGQAFNIRGIGNSEQTASEERIKVVIDGAPKFFEQYRMGSFFGDLELFKRVEILRGPASSTLYGSGAIGGVVTIPTFGFADIHTVDDTATLTWRHGFAANDLLDLTVQLSYTNTVVAKRNFTGSALTCAAGTFQVLCPGDFGYETLALKVENTADLSVGDWQNSVTLGMQLSEQERTATSTLGPLGFHPEGTDRKLGIYAQGEFVWNEKMTLIPGLRVDFADRAPSAATVALGGDRGPGQGGVAKAVGAVHAG